MLASPRDLELGDNVRVRRTNKLSKQVKEILTHVSSMSDFVAMHKVTGLLNEIYEVLPTCRLSI